MGSTAQCRDGPPVWGECRQLALTVFVPPFADFQLSNLSRRRSSSVRDWQLSVEEDEWRSGSSTSVDDPVRPSLHRSLLISFDYLVGLREEQRWDGQLQRLRCPRIDHQLKFCGLLDGQVGGLGALQYFVHIRCAAPEPIGNARPVGQEAAKRRILPGIEDRRQPVLCDVVCDASPLSE